MYAIFKTHPLLRLQSSMMAVVFSRFSSCGPISSSVPPLVKGELALLVSSGCVSCSEPGTHNETRLFFNNSISLLSNEKFRERESFLEPESVAEAIFEDEGKFWSWLLDSLGVFGCGIEGAVSGPIWFSLGLNDIVWWVSLRGDFLGAWVASFSESGWANDAEYTLVSWLSTNPFSSDVEEAVKDVGLLSWKQKNKH